MAATIAIVVRRGAFLLRMRQPRHFRRYARLFARIVAAIVCAQNACAQSAPTPSEACPLPCSAVASDSTIDVVMQDGTIIRDCRAVRRDVFSILGRGEQGLRLTTIDGQTSTDTLFPVGSAKAFTVGGLGGAGSPVYLPIHSVREFYRPTDVSLPASFVELEGYLCFGGSDASVRKIGFASTLFGAAFRLAPFSTLFGQTTALSLGAEAMWENSRQRFAALAQLRFALTSGLRVADVVRYVPDRCRFACFTPEPAAAPMDSIVELPQQIELDSLSYFLREKAVERFAFRPYLYFEGGPIFDGTYDGSGNTPSLNQADYSEWTAGIGFGAVIREKISIGIGYRFLRLNLRTPCPACVDQFIVNTNQVHALLIRAGIHLGW
jgi:hypothetical protein